MHPKNIRTNLATASLVVMAACLAGPHIIRAGKFFWDYPIRRSDMRLQQHCLWQATYQIPKDAPFYKNSNHRFPTWSVDSYRYEYCLEGVDIPDDSLVQQPKFLSEKPDNPYSEGPDLLVEFMLFLRDPLNDYWRVWPF